MCSPRTTRGTMTTPTCSSLLEGGGGGSPVALSAAPSIGALRVAAFGEQTIVVVENPAGAADDDEDTTMMDNVAERSFSVAASTAVLGLLNDLLPEDTDAADIDVATNEKDVDVERDHEDAASGSDVNAIGRSRTTRTSLPAPRRTTRTSRLLRDADGGGGRTKKDCSYTLHGGNLYDLGLFDELGDLLDVDLMDSNSNSDSDDDDDDDDDDVLGICQRLVRQ